MKKKSTSKLAFFSLRVLPGLVATAFIAFALALSHAVGDTLLCGNVTTSNCSNPTMTVNVCAHDGSPLVTDIYLKDNAQRPVLVLRGCEARCGITAQVLQTIWPPNATYSLVVQDIRGSPFCHERAFIGDLLYKFDQDDSHALLEYIDQQTWSQGADGRIAMNVWSNGGVVNYLAAVGAGASLRGIQTHYATGDLLNYGLFNGGVLHNEIPFPYDLPVKPSWAEYVGWPIWDKYLITDNDAALAKVAGLHVGGWFDVSGQGILDSFSRLQIAGGTGARLNQKVVIGPWTHGGEGSPPVGQIQFPSPAPSNPSLSDYDAKWKKGVLENNWTEWNALPAVKVYLMNAPQGTEWTTYTTWPPPAVEVPFYFTLTRALSRTPQRVNGQLPFTSDPSHPCPTLGGTNNLTSCAEPSPVPCGPWDQRPIEARSDVVVFTSGPDPLGNGGPIVGRIYADVWIATDLPDVDVFVRMTDVYPPDATHRRTLDADGAGDPARALSQRHVSPAARPEPADESPRRSAIDRARPQAGAQVAGDRQRVGRPEPRWRRSALQRQPPERRRIHRRASECNRIDQGARRDRSRIGPRHTRSHWPDPTPPDRARTPRLALIKAMARPMAAYRRNNSKRSFLQ